MEFQATAADKVIKALNFEQVLAGNICPHCGSEHRRVFEHIKKCKAAKLNIQKASEIDLNVCWAIHKTCGKSLIIDHEDGLCLIECDTGRYVVPITSLTFGHLSKIISDIEKYELCDDEISKIINILRIKAKNAVEIPKYPELWPGCRVEVQMGDTSKFMVIKEKRGYMYIAKSDCNKTINISSKSILRII